MDPIEFLGEHAPFSDLTAKGRAELARHLEITYARASDRVLDREGVNVYLHAIRKGAVRLELDGQQVDEIGPGEIFGLTALSGIDTPSLDAVAVQDCLFYRFHRDAVRALFSSEPAFAAFFLSGLSARLRALTDGSPVPIAGDLGVPIGELIARPPVAIARAASVGDAARVMDRERVSSVLVVEGEAPPAGSPVRPIGILTDRDLRARVLAAGRGPETPVAEVMTHPVETVDAALPTSEAILMLLRRHIHHLPIARDGEVIGLVANTDLLRHHRHGPVALLKRIEKARDADALSRYADDVAAMVESLDRGGLEAAEIGRVVAALNDALVSRLLGFAQIELGPAPCPFAWIVFGSEGRQEQSFLTDQDNALIYAVETPAARDYFPRLAELGVEALIKVGFPPCAGGFMATNWCRPIVEWRSMFDDWIASPEPTALMKAANFFDFRTVFGGLDLETLEEPLRESGRHRLFIAHLARAAMEMRPPLGLLNRIREKPEGIDLKAGALMPIVGLARVFALEAGERSGSTLRRLRSAQRARVLSEDGCELLTEAFRFVFALRLRTQLAARRAGESIDNLVRLDELSPSEGRHLKEAFIAVHDMQRATAQRLGVDRLG